MKREEVRELFPDATDEQVDGILNRIAGELNPLKTRLKDAEAAGSRVDELEAARAALEAQLADANAKVAERMTDEKRMKAREEAAAAKEREFARKSNALDARAVFVEAGVPSDAIEGLLAQVVGEDAEATLAGAKAIAATLTAVRDAAVQSAREELLKSNPKPQGGGSGEPGMPKTLKEFLALPDAKQMELKAAEPGIIARLRTNQQ